MRVLGSVCASFLLALSAVAQGSGYEPEVKPASEEGVRAIAGFEVAEGLRVELFAAEPMLANPVSFAIDEKGQFYVCETFRHHAGVTDNRSHGHRRGWVDDDLACETVEDRVAMYRSQLGDEFADYLVDHERLRWIADEDGDGVADRSRVFADGFRHPADGIAAGVLVDRGDVWYTCIPRLWFLRDADGDGVAETRRALHDGFGVHTALLGHDMHGLCFGPDGKLYFSIGDRGFNLVTAEGRRIVHPHTGAVLRCNRDGSELEVYATGLRNPQELAFDDFGNLFTGENNSDGGDRARWVYVVEGGDSGWRMNYQYLPTRGPWNEEKLWNPHFPGQAAWIVPPIANLGNGPSGLTYWAGGGGLPERYRNNFFLCDFRGGSARSGVHTISVRPSGAGFELASTGRLIWRVLVTDVDFGPDGGVYVTDWTEGWNKTGKGRIYRIFDPERIASPLVAETRALLRDGMAGRSTLELIGLLGHADRRVRQRAQFELVARPETSAALAQRARLADAGTLGRVHALWALGQRARHDGSVLQSVMGLLADDDSEIRAQVVKVLGEARVQSAGPALEKLLGDSSARVRYFAALGLGKLGRASARDAIFDLLRDNADEDPVLRHAGVMALAGMGDVDALCAAAGDPSPAVRRGVMLTLRRLERPEIRRFLRDQDPSLVLGAARAIHDIGIDVAMPDLALLIGRRDLEERPLLRRVVNANYRLGGVARASALAVFAADAAVDATMRVEAMRALRGWPQPSGRDRVLGNWRPLPERPGADAVAALRPVLTTVLNAKAEPVAVEGVRAVQGLAIADAAPLLDGLIGAGRAAPTVQVAALRALAALSRPSLAAAVQRAAQVAAPIVRREALRQTARLDPAAALPAVQRVLDRGPAAEQREALRILGEMQFEGADGVLSEWLDRLLRGEVPLELRFDLVEAAQRKRQQALDDKLQRYEAAKRADDPLARYVECLEGGDRKAGEVVFREHLAAQCVRCHTQAGAGGDAGPLLDGVGSRRSRRELLLAMVNPNAAIASGFGTVVVTMRDGQVHAGLLREQDDKTLRIQPAAGAELTLPVAQIRERTTPVSTMPPMPGILTRRELRDLVAFLASLSDTR